MSESAASARAATSVRYAFAGDRDVAVEVLSFLVQEGHPPAALLVSGARRASHADALIELARLPAELIARGSEFRDPEWVARLTSMNLDFIIGVHFPYIVPPEVLAIPREGVLNLHPAFLPYNRGWHTPSWAILEGTPIGATLHFMDAGVDTGDIVAQREIAVSCGDTAHSLYGRLKALEVGLFRDAWPSLRDRSYQRTPQPRGEGSSHRRQDLMTDDVRKIDLDQHLTARELIRRLRSLTTSDPAEAAYFEEHGRRFRLQISVQEEPRNDLSPPDPGIARPEAARIYLSPPHLHGDEQSLVRETFASNWIAPLGPQVDAFERELAEVVGSPHAVALSSGTAALHLALLLHGVQPGDEVVVSSFTFVGSVNPIVYLGARPVFVDSERASWNMDPSLLEDFLEGRAREGRLPRAVVVVHLYGQVADLDSLLQICGRFGVPLIEDAAEALGAEHRLGAPGSLGVAGIFSFNGNKIITTSGGGMLTTSDGALAERARGLAAQARDPAPHYEHSRIGYNYRLSNVLAAIGRGQLRHLAERVAARRANFNRYQTELGELPGIEFMPEAGWGRHSRWLTTLTIDPELFGSDREAVRHALDSHNIESRPLWKPMHLQPVFRDCESIGGAVSADLFDRGLCLPSGSAMSRDDLMRVADIVRDCHAGRPAGSPGMRRPA